MFEILYLLKANSAFSSGVLKLKGTAILYTAEDIDVARLGVFISFMILFLI